MLCCWSGHTELESAHTFFGSVNLNLWQASNNTDLKHATTACCCIGVLHVLVGAP